MGQKINPISIRLGINKDWDSNWYPPKDSLWAPWLKEDVVIRNFVLKNERDWAIGKLAIEKSISHLHVIIHTAKAAVVLGDGGKRAKELEKQIEKITKNPKGRVVKVEVIEITEPDLNATIMANEIAIALESRAPFRIAQKFAIRKIMKAGAKGVKTKVSGRLGGVEMARSEGYTFGVVPLQTFRQDIDYAWREANTTYGKIGVKVWISKGEILSKKEKPSNKGGN